MAEPASAPSDGLSSALTTGRALILLQLLSRLLTFALNQGLVRLAPPAVFGTAAIQFDLVAATVLFLSREGVRNALLRRKGDDDNDGNSGFSTQDAALATLPFKLGCGVAVAVLALYLSTSSAETTSQPYFHVALRLYVYGALAELAIEPLYVRALRESPPRIRVRVQAEGGMAIVRAVVTFACLVLDPSGQRALLGFAIGHSAGASWLAARYVYEYGGLKVLPSLFFPKTNDQTTKREETGAASTRALAIANTRQSVVKHVLTEADRLAVGRISPLGDQGGYAVAMNYGSLVARIIFQPIEETLLLHWSRALDSPSTLPLLTLALRLSLHLLLLLPVFLPPLLPIVLPVLLPRRYVTETDAASTLQTYLVCYLPVLSFNGILEAFHAASATPEQVARQAWFMIASSVAFAWSLVVFTGVYAGWFMGYGRTAGGVTRSPPPGLLTSIFHCTTEQALIYSSCVAMSTRIAYAWPHAQGFFRKRGTPLTFAAIVPKARVRYVVAVTGAGLWVLAYRLGTSLRDQAILLAVGAVAGILVLYTIYTAEHDQFSAIGASLGRHEREPEPQTQPKPKSE